MSRSDEEALKVFGITNQLLEHDLDRVEQEHAIDLNRGHRGSGCSFISAIVSIVASKGNSDPAWFETTRARPCDGTFATPSVSTRHQTS